MSDDKEVVLVVGGNGFLGQHIVKLLHEDAKVSVIRVLDIVRYQKKLDFEEVKPVEVFVGDICDTSSCKDAFRGADVAIHVAAVFSFGIFPETQRMQKVNVQGTKNVVRLCREMGVGRLVFGGTTDVVTGFKDLIYTREIDAPPPEDRKFAVQEFADTMLTAEQHVLKNDNVPLDTVDDGFLRTVSIRPPTLYGELDPYTVPEYLKAAKKNGGVLYKIGNRDKINQVTYVGNAAWAHVLAKDALKQNVKEVGGEAIFVTDDTTPKNAFEFAEPFLQLHGCRLSSYFIPYWLAILIVSFLTMISRIIGRPLVGASPGEVSYVCTTIYLNRLKARLRLDYLPKYTEVQAMNMATKYYSSLSFT